jgi:hypothetical protein
MPILHFSLNSQSPLDSIVLEPIPCLNESPLVVKNHVKALVALHCQINSLPSEEIIKIFEDIDSDEWRLLEEETDRELYRPPTSSIPPTLEELIANLKSLQAEELITQTQITTNLAKLLDDFELLATLILDWRTRLEDSLPSDLTSLENFSTIEKFVTSLSHLLD